MEKEMRVLTGRTSREIVATVNEKEINKEDIISIVYRDGQFIMFYYQ